MRIAWATNEIHLKVKQRCLAYVIVLHMKGNKMESHYDAVKTTAGRTRKEKEVYIRAVPVLRLKQ